MTRPPLILKAICELLLNGPMDFQEIRVFFQKSTRKVNRATISKNLKKAKNLGYVEEDNSKKYHLTHWGKSNIKSPILPRESISFEVQTQVIDRLSIRNKRPTAKSMIVIKDAKKIKELDDKSVDIERFLTHDGLGLIENNTFLKAAVATVVDTILDLKAKDLGMITIFDQKFKEVWSPFNQETIFPSFDYLKRYKQLAETTFNVLIEFDGKKWVESQNFGDIEAAIETNRQVRKEIYNNIRSMDLSKRINKVTYMLNPTDVLSDRSLEALRLFKTNELLREYVYNCFKVYSKVEDEEKLRSIILKAFELGYIKFETRKLEHLILDKSKKADFFKYLWQLERKGDLLEETDLPVTDLSDNKEVDLVNNRYENHEALIKEVSNEMKMFKNSLLDLVTKFKDRFDKSQYYSLYKESNISIDPNKSYLADTQLYTDSLQELLRLYHSKTILYLLRSTMFWPRRIHNRRVLNKLNSIVFSNITEMSKLLHEVLTFEVGDAFNAYLDIHVLRKIDTKTNMLDYTKKMFDPIIEKECQSILSSIMHLHTECQQLSYPEPPDIPGYYQFKYK